MRPAYAVLFALVIVGLFVLAFWYMWTVMMTRRLQYEVDREWGLRHPAQPQGDAAAADAART